MSASVELEPVDYRAADGRRYSGFIATPPGTGPHPAVLVAHEAPGLLEHSKRVARRLCHLGYLAFAIDYLGEGRVLTELTEVMEHVGRWVDDPGPLRLACAAAHELLLGRADVDPRRIAGFGYCFGGQALVEYARTGVELAAIVGFHPGMSVVRPVESVAIRPRLLMLVGSADPITSVADRNAFEVEMDGAGVDWRLVTYGGVPHSFTNVDAGGASMSGVAYHAAADADSWEQAVRFLRECGMSPDVSAHRSGDDVAPHTAGPDRYRHSVIPHVFVTPASAAIRFYEEAFGASEIFRVSRPDGRIVHCEMSIGVSVFMVGDADGVFGPPSSDAPVPVGLHAYVSDLDQLHRRAVSAGAVSISPPRPMFYGDRMSMVRDPFGHVWVFLEHIQDLSPEEIKASGEELLASADEAD